MECKNVIKYLVFVLNMTLVLGGVTLLGFGVHVYLDMAIHRPIMGDDYHYVSVVLMILGLSTFLVALFGCLGSYKEYVFVVVINAVCYSLLTLGLFGVVAWLILQKIGMHDNIHEGFGDAMQKYQQENNGNVTVLIDQIQLDFKCCGLTNYRNWIDEENPFGRVPDSCCKIPSPDCAQDITDEQTEKVNDTIFVNGCYSLHYLKFIHEDVGATLTATFVISALTLFNVIFSSIYAKKLRKYSGIPISEPKKEEESQ